VSDSPDDLPDSLLLTFIDEPRAHALYVLEGQRLVRDVALAHGTGGASFAILRDVVLAVEPLVALLSGGEQLGFYLDTEAPELRLKLEASHAGDVRCVLVPRDLVEVPAVVSGLVRVEWRYPGGRQPYLSALRLDGVAIGDVVDRVLRDSYQMKCAVLVSQESDQSLLLHRLPALRGEDPALATIEAVRERLEGLRPEAEAILARALTGEALREAFGGLGFRLLAARPVRFRCTCSREHVVRSLRLLDDPSELFDPGQATIDVTCDYCGRHHAIWRHELVDPPDPVH
jgi:molecular chaperone Hsp33